jgi:hypothetical protein
MADAPKKPHRADNNAHTKGTDASGKEVPLYRPKLPKTMVDRMTGATFTPSDDPMSPNWVSSREYDDRDD